MSNGNVCMYVCVSHFWQKRNFNIAYLLKVIDHGQRQSESSFFLLATTWTGCIEKIASKFRGFWGRIYQILAIFRGFSP